MQYILIVQWLILISVYFCIRESALVIRPEVMARSIALLKRCYKRSPAFHAG